MASESLITNNPPPPDDAPDFGPDLVDPITTIEGFIRLYGEQNLFTFVVEAMLRVRMCPTVLEDPE
jgi:hypothetical protein